MIIGLILSSAFSAIVVYAQELVPGRVGMISGLFFGLAFGIGGLGAALLGELADQTSIGFVYQLCSFLPAIGLLTVFLPNLDRAAGEPRERDVSASHSPRPLSMRSEAARPHSSFLGRAAAAARQSLLRRRPTLHIRPPINN